MEDSDEYCPHCDNHFVLDAKTPQARLEVTGEDVRIDARWVMMKWIKMLKDADMYLRMIKDERTRQEELRTIFDVKDAADRLG